VATLSVGVRDRRLLLAVGRVAGGQDRRGGTAIPEASFRIRVGDFSVGGLTQNVDLQEGFTLATL
jgi:hypothetical protein